LHKGTVDASKIAGEGKLIRVPCELERKFLDILHLILTDKWEIPSGSQWISILNYLNAFEQSSQMRRLDNVFRDCYRFFLKAAKLFGFTKHFKAKHREESAQIGSDVSINISDLSRVGSSSCAKSRSEISSPARIDLQNQASSISPVSKGGAVSRGGHSKKLAVFADHDGSRERSSFTLLAPITPHDLLQEA